MNKTRDQLKRQLTKLGIIVLWITFCFHASSCDTNGDDSISKSWYKPYVSVIYSAEPLQITFDGQNIDSVAYQTEETGNLAVYARESNKKLMDTVVSIKSPIQLIQTEPDVIKFYQKDLFLSFNASLSIPSGYHVEFNKQSIINGNNYLEKSKSKGSFEYYKNDQSDPIFTDTNVTTIEDNSQYILIGDNTNLISLQASSQDTVADPVAETHCKLRFFYTPAANDPDVIEVEFVAVGNETRKLIDPYKSIVLEKGKLSSYIEFDNSVFSSIPDVPTFQCNVYKYDKVTNQRGEQIQKRSGFRKISLKWRPSGGYLTLHKFETYQITGSDNKFRPVFFSGINWE